MLYLVSDILYLVVMLSCVWGTTNPLRCGSIDWSNLNSNLVYLIYYFLTT